MFQFIFVTYTDYKFKGLTAKEKHRTGKTIAAIKDRRHNEH